MTHLTLALRTDADISRTEKFINGESEGRRFLLANADFVYRIADIIGSIEEKQKTIPQSVIYFFQTLLKASGELDNYPDLVTKLALLDNAIVNPKTFLPRYQLFADDLEVIRKLVLPHIIEEHAEFGSNLGAGDIEYIFNNNFRDFARSALRLVGSENFLIFARDSIPRISILNYAIRDRELSFVNRVIQERELEIIPDDLYGNGAQYDPELGFLENLKAQYRSNNFILGPAG